MSGSVLDPPRPDAPVIDRRLRARRIEVRRHEGRRRLRRLVALVVATLLVVAGWGVTRSPLLDVDHLEVVGIGHTTLDDALAATGISRGDALVDLDLAAVERGVLALPWVATATAERTWGGRVTVTVTERTAVAVLTDPDGRDWFVDADGRTLGEASSAPGLADDLLRVVGFVPPAPGDTLVPRPSRLIALVEGAPASVRAAVDAVLVDADDEVWMLLAPRDGEVDAEGSPRTEGGRIRLGDLRDVDRQLLAAATVLARVDLTDLVLLDLRVPSNPVVVERTPGVAA